MNRSLKAQFKYADKKGARFVAVIGESELNEGVAQVKDLRNSFAERIKFEELEKYLKEKE